jgi:hypothetical protein
MRSCLCTCPRGRTWAPVVADGRLERNAETAPVHSHPVPIADLTHPGFRACCIVP